MDLFHPGLMVAYKSKVRYGTKVETPRLKIASNIEEKNFRDGLLVNISN